jgi:hypothetical protein
VFKNGFKPIILNNFTTKADVIDACLCSCHIPLFMVTFSFTYSLTRLLTHWLIGY